MRDDEEISFNSKVDWRTLRIGPESTTDPRKKKSADDDGEEADDMQ